MTPSSFQTHVMTDTGQRIERAEDDAVVLNPTFGRRRWGAPRGIVSQAAPMTPERRVEAYLWHNALCGSASGLGRLTPRQRRQLRRKDRSES